jgi:hypothetical protein
VHFVGEDSVRIVQSLDLSFGFGELGGEAIVEPGKDLGRNSSVILQIGYQ